MSTDYLVKLKKIYKSYNKHSRFSTNKILVLEDINFEIKQGEIFGLVGESGGGKSTLCNLILGLDRVDKGSIHFGDIDITKISDKEMRMMRKNVQAVFQDAKSSLNPKMKVIDIINEPLKNFGIEDKDRLAKLLDTVGLDKSFLSRYPHELSGGQRQRVSIARALALNPKFIILDESTSNLDTITLNKILILLKKLNHDLGLTYLFISHDINIIKSLCDRVAIIKNGKIVEILDKMSINNARHHYSKILLNSSCSEL